LVVEKLRRRQLEGKWGAPAIPVRLLLGLCMPEFVTLGTGNQLFILEQQ